MRRGAAISLLAGLAGKERVPVAGRQLPTGRPCEEGRTLMATYILLSTLTDEGRKTVKEKPSRIQEVNKEIESMGAKVVGQWVVLGPYDFVNVVEAPDNETIARISLELGARGTIQIMTLPAIPVEVLQARLRK
jgi:uncharacterized protein with GYD domain